MTELEPLSPGTVRAHPIDGQNYVWIPPGRFMMGLLPGEGETADFEASAHVETIPAGFWMGQTPVTFGAFRKYTAAMTAAGTPPNNPWLKEKLNDPSVHDDMPLANVHPIEAEAYCAWAGLRLPTEAEWEYAARAGSTASRYGELDDIAWHVENSGKQRFDSSMIHFTHPSFPAWLKENGNGPHPVGRKRPNAWNLYDMLGNVFQWTSDGSPWMRTRKRALRGACWSSYPENIRVSARSWVGPAAPEGSGFRCVWDGSS